MTVISEHFRNNVHPGSRLLCTGDGKEPEGRDLNDAKEVNIEQLLLTFSLLILYHHMTGRIAIYRQDSYESFIKRTKPYENEWQEIADEAFAEILGED